jgi:hypothetical protein
MLKKVILLLIAVCLILSGFIGCSNEVAEKSADTANNEEVYSVKIYLKGSFIKSITLDEIDALKKVTFSAEGKDEDGPKLTDVLKLADIVDFNQVTVVGLVKGRVASAELVLTRDQINDMVILDITNNGTTKLAGADIPSDNWIIDVSELRVE